MFFVVAGCRCSSLFAVVRNRVSLFVVLVGCCVLLFFAVVCSCCCLLLLQCVVGCCCGLLLVGVCCLWVAVDV